METYVDFPLEENLNENILLDWLWLREESGMLGYLPRLNFINDRLASLRAALQVGPKF